MNASAWSCSSSRRKLTTGSAKRPRISATAGLAVSDSETMIRRRSRSSWSRSTSPAFASSPTTRLACATVMSVRCASSETLSGPPIARVISMPT
jgi:hypothetical protein